MLNTILGLIKQAIIFAIVLLLIIWILSLVGFALPAIIIKLLILLFVVGLIAQLLPLVF